MTLYDRLAAIQKRILALKNKIELSYKVGITPKGLKDVVTEADSIKAETDACMPEVVQSENDSNIQLMYKACVTMYDLYLQKDTEKFRKALEED